MKTIELPANLVEFDDHRQAKLLDKWTINVTAWTMRAIQGDPWSVDYDHDRNYYYNPQTTEVPDDAARAIVRWSAFPNRVQYLMEQTHQMTEESDIMELVDGGRYMPNIPSIDCPRLDLDSPRIAYHPPGPRGWLDEYCEFCIEYDDDYYSKIRKVSFTCENSDYWYTLWDISPERVLELYQKLSNPSVEMSDLILHDKTGKIVINEMTGQPAYNPVNNYNWGSLHEDVRGGAMHLTSPPNTLPAEIYIAASASVNRTDNETPQALVCAGNYGGPFRHSDPHINFEVNQLVTSKNVRVNIANPVGLYIQTPDFSGYELPDVPGAKGRHASEFWKVYRGHTQGANPDLPSDMDYILHAKFEVPKELGFSVSDIKIYGKKIRYAAQIAKTFKVALAATAIPSDEELPAALPAQAAKQNPKPTPEFMMLASALADKNGGLPRDATPTLPIVLSAGEKLKEVAIICSNLKEGAIFDAGPHVTITFKELQKDRFVLASGMENYNHKDVCIVEVKAKATAEQGFCEFSIANPGEEPGVPAKGFIYIQ